MIQAAVEDGMVPPDDDVFEARARFCLVTGVAPSEYDQMLPEEVRLWIETYNALKD